MRPAMISLLAMIRSKEAPKGYGQVYGGAKPPSIRLVNCATYTVDGVLALQKRMLDNGSRSTACAGYQFIRRTLNGLKLSMKLSGKEVMSAELQDRMAIRLMEGRGLLSYMAGGLSAEAFANNLAMEWASIPVVTRIKGQKRIVNPGETFYAGDGLNKAHHDPKKFLAAVKALREQHPLRRARGLDRCL